MSEALLGSDGKSPNLYHESSPYLPESMPGAGLENKPPEAAGGQGAETVEQRTGHERADARTIARAIKERWPIPESTRPALMAKMLKIALDPNSSQREAIAAARVVIGADRQNQLDELEARMGPNFHAHLHAHVALDAEQTRAGAAAYLSAQLRKLLIGSGESSADDGGGGVGGESAFPAGEDYEGELRGELA